MTHITTTSQAGIDLIMQHEGYRQKAYLCPAGYWTIGYGATFYQDGQRVKKGDAISDFQAQKLLEFHLRVFEKEVDNATRDDLSQHQFDALVSFCFNVGPTNFKNSTLLRKVNANPNDPAISSEFAKWTKGNGRTLPGLVKRRSDESKLYFQS